MTAARLVVVGTPIGNLGDLPPRAVEALASADLVVCEDTRRTRKLLSAAGVAAPELLAAPDHQEASRIPTALDRLRRGRTVVLVSDAGMPAVSDPGERLVRAAISDGHAVEVVPGPSAALAALVLSGLPTGRWCFEGFLPRRGSARRARLESLRTEERTMVLFEAPNRVGATLTDLVASMGGDRRVAVARELTKLHEEVWRGTLAEAVSHVERVTPRGEHVLVVAGAAPPAAPGDDELVAELRSRLGAGASTRDAVDAVAAAHGAARRRVYDLALGLDRGDGAPN